MQSMRTVGCTLRQEEAPAPPGKMLVVVREPLEEKAQT